MAYGAPDHRLVIDLVELVKLINKIEEITKISEITDLKNIDSVDLVDRITRIDSIDSLGELSIGKFIPLVSPPLLLFDDFESGVFKWKMTGNGRTVLTSERAFSGSASVNLCTVPVSGTEQFMKRYFSVTADLTMRLSARVALGSTNVRYLRIYLVRYFPPGYLNATVRYDVAGTKWQYVDPSTGWTDVPGGAQDLRLDPDTWHLIQLEANFSTKKYNRLKVGPLDVDMSALGIPETSNAYKEYAEVIISVETDANAKAEAWVDDVFVEVW